jgi:haloalkane dehalogenase
MATHANCDGHTPAAGHETCRVRAAYVAVDGLRMAYLDEGPSEGPTILVLHSEPTWGFLYRRMLQRLIEAALRCVVPDLIGFGRSDKPTEQFVYTYAGHVA